MNSINPSYQFGSKDPEILFFDSNRVVHVICMLLYVVVTGRRVLQWYLPTLVLFFFVFVFFLYCDYVGLPE